MKIPKTLKLPRKLKKELKKGFKRNITPHYPVFDSVCRENGTSLNMYETVSYSGSNTKAFRRLCKVARKNEKICFNRKLQVFVNNLIDKQKNINKIANNFDNTTSMWFL